MDSSNSEIIGLIPDWLSLTRDTDIPLGLSREEAFSRARQLRRLLREESLSSPTSIEADEDFKDVLHALVLLLSESAADQPDGLLEEADAVYQFIRRIAWGDDDFDEERSLLRQCAETGWHSARTSISDSADFRHQQVSGEAQESALAFLGNGLGENSTDRKLSDPVVLAAVCRLLSSEINSNPRLGAERARAVYQWLSTHQGAGGFFDGRDFFLGESARLAGSAVRLLGDLDEAESWLERAQAGFRKTVNPGPPMAQAAYLRLTLAYDRRRFRDVVDLAPSLLESFEKFGMRSEAAKTRFLEALTLKGCSRDFEALEKFTNLSTMLNEQEDTGLLGQVVVEIGAYRALDGQYEEAINCYQKGLSLLAKTDRPYAVAHLRMTVGETFRIQGNLVSAVEAFREGVRGYADLGMKTYVAYARITLAETLLALGRNREAEWEILSALPTVEEQKMVPEGFAAVAILRESVNRRQADPNALRELREHLKANG